MNYYTFISIVFSVIAISFDLQLAILLAIYGTIFAIDQVCEELHNKNNKELKP